MAKEVLSRPWLLAGRAGAALILGALAAGGGDGLLVLGAGGAGAAALLTPFSRAASAAAGLFLVDVLWIAASVLGVTYLHEGLTLLFPVVAVAAGFQVGGWRALVISVAAAVGLASTRILAAGDPGHLTGLGLQGVLVLVMGAVADRARAHLASRERALAMASQALERMRLDTDLLVENLPSGVMSLDADGVVVHYNHVAERILGTAADAVRGRPAPVAFPETIRPLVEILERGLRSGQVEKRVECELRANGRALPVGVGTTLLLDPRGKVNGVVGVFQDLTDVRRQQELARRRERLAAVGELAAGIAHEIRNSVLPLSGSVQILSRELELDAEQRRLFQVIEREMDNVERFVGDLLNYTRDQVLRVGPVDLAVLARETAEELGAGDGAAIEVRAEEVWALGDREQIRQALRNLVLNARDAGGTRGRVVLRTGRGGDGKSWIEVEDNGPGLAEDLTRVVQPFYTTKPGGTGLGLAIVQRIMEDHEGRLERGNPSLGGACLRLVLPRAGNPHAELATAA